MQTTCAECGRKLSEHDRHVRFMLPDPLANQGIDVGSTGFWMSHDTAGESVFMAVDGVGSFLRSLLPVRLTGGYRVTFGVWIGVPHHEMLRAFELWNAPSYVNLAIDGLLANSLPIWGLLGSRVHLEVRDPEQTPYCTSSSDDGLSSVLAEAWPHELVLPHLPA